MITKKVIHLDLLKKKEYIKNTHLVKRYAPAVIVVALSKVGGGKNLMDQSKTETELRIRKLTPKECFRLMGLKDEDIEKVMEHQTNASGYHLAGDSIVTTCIMRIASQFIGIDYKDKFKPEEWWKDA